MTETFVDDAQRFRLESRIATGGMGEVWRATDTVLGREVAVKLLKAEYADDATFRSRFETEARHAAALHHPGVAAIFDVGESAPTDGSGHPRPFLVMELVEGRPLSALLEDAQVSGRELDATAVRDLLAQTGDALGAAHRAGIVHRDVKPANLMVTPQGEVKVTDFGIARAAEGVGITRTGAVMGTPQYLSPEQAEGRAATAASDVYALGVVAFECLAGRRPFEAESPVATALAHIREPVPDLPSGVPGDLAAVVRRALAKDPADRYPDGAAFAAALRDPAGAAPPTPRTTVVPEPVPVGPATAVLAEVPPAAAAPPPTSTAQVQHAEGNRRRSAWPIVAVVVVIVALAVAITLLATRGGNGSPTADDQRSSSSSPPPTSSSSAPSASSSTPDETVSFDPGNYIGQPYDQVKVQLEDQGLVVDGNPTDNTDPQQNGIVTKIEPDSGLHRGDRVFVTYHGDAPTTPPTSTGPTSSTPPTSTPPTTPPTTLPTSSSADGTATSGAAEGEG